MEWSVVAFYMAPCDDEIIIVKKDNDDVILHVFCVFKNGYFNTLMISMNFIIYFRHFSKLIIYLSTNFNVKI